MTLNFATTCRRPAARPAGRGVTLIELLVSLAILSVAILAFSMILAQTRKVVSSSQTQMKANSVATSIMETIREDLSQVTPHGFFCITQADVMGGSPQLLFATAGPRRSLTGGPTGTAGIVGYGLAHDGRGGFVLWRRQWVLRPSQGEDYAVAGWHDLFGYDLSHLQVFARGDGSGTTPNLNDNVITQISTGQGSAILPVPPLDVGELLTHQHEYLSENCADLTIEWTDGHLDSKDRLRWFGITKDGNNYVAWGTPNDLKPIEKPDPKNTDWEGRDVMSDKGSDFDVYKNGGGTKTYRALWTHREDNWPKAVRIRFTLLNYDAGSDVEPVKIEYSLICPVGR